MTDKIRFNNFKVPLYNKLGYASGNLGSGVIFEAVTAYIVFYCTVILKMPGAIIGILVSVSVLVDAITDPVMGYISDHTHSRRYGKRHLYILAGTFLVSIVNAFIWIVSPDYSLLIKTVWIFTTMISIKIALTIYLTPYSALGAEISDNYHERSSIQSMKTIGFLMGIVLVTVGYLFVFFKATPEYPKGQMNPEAYPLMGLASSAFMLIFGLISYFSTIRYKRFLKDESHANELKKSFTVVIVKMAKSFLSSLKNKNFACIVKGYLFTNLLSVLANSFALHVYTFTFGLGSSQIAVLLGLQLSMAVLSQPVWIAFSRRFDKKPSIMSGILLGCLGCILLSVVVILRQQIEGVYYLLIIISLLLGFGTGVMLSMPYSMVADTVDIEEASTGKRTEGIFYGVMTLCYKASQSIVLIFLGGFLQLIGFDADKKVQTHTASTSIGMIVAVGGVIALSLATWAYKSYKLDKRTVEECQKNIQMAKLIESGES